MNVLLVTDDDRQRRSLVMALSLRGHDVSVIGNSTAALEMARGQEFPLVVIDRFAGGLPEQLALCRRLRALPTLSGSVIWPIIDATRPEDVVAALDAGASNYLAHPIDVTQLRARVEDVERRFAGRPTRQRNQDDVIPVRDRDRALIEQMPGVVAILEVGGDIGYVSPSVTASLGWTPEDLIGRNCFAICHPDDVARLLRHLMNAINQEGDPAPVSVRLQHQDGSWRNMEARFRDLRESPEVAGIVMLAQDVTERAEFQAKLERQALYDPLTDLPNRALFLDHLEQALARAERHHEPVALLFLDLDNFKAINDTWGHVFGDRALTAFARVFRSCLRASDTAARLSGDEFSVLIEDLSTEQDVLTIANRLLDTLREPIAIDGREVVIGVSIGIAFSQPGRSTPTDLLDDADRALYHAKASGKSRLALARDKEIELNLSVLSARGSTEEVDSAPRAIGAPSPPRDREPICAGPSFPTALEPVGPEPAMSAAPRNQLSLVERAAALERRIAELARREDHDR